MDIIEAALADHHAINGDTDTRWNVKFVNNDQRKGDLEALGDGNYVLKRSSTQKPYYFSANAVVFLFPDN